MGVSGVDSYDFSYAIGITKKVIGENSTLNLTEKQKLVFYKHVLEPLFYDFNPIALEFVYNPTCSLCGIDIPSHEEVVNWLERENRVCDYCQRQLERD